MIETPEIAIERVAFAAGSRTVSNLEAGVDPKIIEATGFPARRVAAEGESLKSLFLKAAEDIPKIASAGGVVVATFSAQDRFPSLAVSLASALKLPSSAPAIDVSAACSAYPYALYVAGRIAADTGKKVLLFDGDLQSPLTDPSDIATAPLFSDAATVSVVSSSPGASAKSQFAFYSRASDALNCPAGGPVSMDGFGVFSFVAAEVAPFLKDFLSEAGGGVDAFVPHQANMYMVRQLARSLGLEDRLATSGEVYANPGSCSVPLTIAHAQVKGRALLAGFGAGLSASAAIVKI